MDYHIVTYGWDIGWRLWVDSFAWLLGTVLVVASLVILYQYAGSIFGRRKGVEMTEEEEKAEVDRLMSEAMTEESITCPECAEVMEVNDTKCECGWENILVKKGLIPGGQ